MSKHWYGHLISEMKAWHSVLIFRQTARGGQTASQLPFTEIPVLDYAQTASPSTRSTFLAALKDAIVNVGFFYLKNTGVSPELYQALSEQSSALFNLSLEKKLEIEMVNSKHFLGYSRLGQEITALKNDYREQFDVRVLYSPRLLSTRLSSQFATELPAPGPEEPLYRNIRGPNQVSKPCPPVP